MKLQNLETGASIEAEIIGVTEEDHHIIEGSEYLQFDWKEEKKYYIVKIRLIGHEEILGLMSLIDRPDELRIHVNLIESTKENIGRKKKIGGIAGCLLAFATQYAFEKGYQGFVSLVPKTELIGSYVRKYGFTQFGRQLAIDGRAAIALIKKYG